MPQVTTLDLIYWTLYNLLLGPESMAIHGPAASDTICGNASLKSFPRWNCVTQCLPSAVGVNGFTFAQRRGSRKCDLVIRVEMTQMKTPSVILGHVTCYPRGALAWKKAALGLAGLCKYEILSHSKWGHITADIVEPLGVRQGWR